MLWGVGTEEGTILRHPELAYQEANPEEGTEEGDKRKNLADVIQPLQPKSLFASAGDNHSSHSQERLDLILKVFGDL